MKQQELLNKLNQAIERFVSQLSEMRTGVASSALIENIIVPAYEGSNPMSLKELATISVTSSNLLVVEPWDRTIIEKIALAINKSGKGLNPSIDGSSLKIPIPQLTEEIRRDYVKEAKKRLEEAKILVRNIRHEAIKAVEEQEDEGGIGEDEMTRVKKEIEEKIKETNQKLEEMFEAKERELMNL